MNEVSTQQAISPGTQAHQRRKPSRRKTGLLMLAFTMLAVGLALSIAAYYSKSAQLSNIKKNPGELTQQQTNSLIAQVQKLIQLPGGKPTIVTVEDKSKLKDQAFFDAAKNGDKVLMYTTAKKAILYRPSTDKIINVATLNIKG